MYEGMLPTYEVGIAVLASAYGVFCRMLARHAASMATLAVAM